MLQTRSTVRADRGRPSGPLISSVPLTRVFVMVLRTSNGGESTAAVHASVRSCSHAPEHRHRVCRVRRAGHSPPTTRGRSNGNVRTSSNWWCVPCVFDVAVCLSRSRSGVGACLSGATAYLSLRHTHSQRPAACICAYLDRGKVDRRAAYVATARRRGMGLPGQLVEQQQGRESSCQVETCNRACMQYATSHDTTTSKNTVATQSIENY